MPLFGWGKPNTDKLFDRFARTVFRYIEHEHNRVPLTGSAEINRAVANIDVAQWSGGMIAAKSAVKLVPSVKRAWGSGDYKKAASLSLLFTLPMVLRYVLSVDRGKSSSERIQSYKRWISSIGRTFAVPPLDNEQLMADYQQLSIQFDHSLDHQLSGKPTGWLIEPRFLLSRALALHGAPLGMDISGVQFPVESEAEFVSRGGHRGEFDDSEVILIQSILGNSADAMMKLL